MGNQGKYSRGENQLGNIKYVFVEEIDRDMYVFISTHR